MSTILLVDDDCETARPWREQLESHEHRVIHITTVEAAIRILDQESIDLVVTDIALESTDPELSKLGGLAVISYIVLNIRPQPKIIATSGAGGNQTFVDYGFRRIDSLRTMRKPISGKLLLTAVEELLSLPNAPQNVIASEQLSKATAELEETRYSNQALVELLGASDGVWDWKVGSDSMVFAPRFRMMLGFDAADSDGLPNVMGSFADRIHPDDRDEVWTRVNHTLQTREPFEHEFRLRHRDGHYLWVRSRAVASLNETGEAVRMVGVTHDKTEERRLADELDETTQLLKVAITNANIGMWTWDFHHDHVVVSNTLKAQLGYSVDEPWNDFEAWRSKLHPDDRDTAIQWARSLQANPEHSHQSVFRLRTASGNYCWIRSVGQGLYGSNGELQKIVGVHIDVQDERETQQRLALAEQRFRAVANINTPCWIMEADATCSWLNRKWVEFTGVPLEQQIGFGWLDSVHPHDVEVTRTAYLDAVERQADFEVEYRLRRHDGQYRLHHAIGSARRDERQQFQGFVGYSVDIHDERQAKTQLMQINQELEQFTYIASHDLKQPLRGIRHLSQWIYDDAYDRLPAASREHLRKLQGRIDRLDHLLDDLLAYSRAGRKKCKVEPVCVQPMINQIAELLAAPRGFVIEYAGPALEILTARTQLETVFRNLIGNAVKHRSEDDGYVEVAAQVIDNQMIEFRVSDNGPGIAPEFQDRVFRMFQTLNTRDEMEGSGIGLAIVERIVHSMGGEVTLESEVGQGATFRFTWPKTIGPLEEDLTGRR